MPFSRGKQGFLYYKAKKGKEKNKKKRKAQGQVRWPFGPPHLTLKPSKTKNKKNTKRKRNKEGLGPSEVGPTSSPNKCLFCGSPINLSNTLCFLVLCSLKLFPPRCYDWVPSMLFSFFYCAFFVLSFQVPQPPLSTRILCFLFCSQFILSLYLHFHRQSIIFILLGGFSIFFFLYFCAEVDVSFFYNVTYVSTLFDFVCSIPASASSSSLF